MPPKNATTSFQEFKPEHNTGTLTKILSEEESIIVGTDYNDRSKDLL